MHNFVLAVVDTDSISICKPDMSPFDEHERLNLLNEINSKFPEHIKYADDGYFEKCIVLKAKNYILYDGKKTKIKGSALKGSTKCEKLKNFTKEVIDVMIQIDDQQEMFCCLQKLYNNYVQEIMNIKDIKPWSSRKTLSSTMTESERTNELKIIEALKGSPYTEGDRFFTFFRSDDSVCLAENFAGDYNRPRLLKNLYDTISIFKTILPIKELFLNYALKKNYKILLGAKDESR